MINHETRVALTYNIGGALLSTREKDSTGKTVPKMTYSLCQVRTTLGEEFVTFAISVKDGRPDRKRYPAIYSRWFKMSLLQRLEWHLVNLVSSHEGGGMSYKLI